MILKNINFLWQLIVQHKWKLLITYLLFSLEMLGLLVRPYFLGNAINDLINRNYQGLIYLVLAHLLYTIVGFIRHRYDSRTYASIYTQLVTSYIKKNQNKLGTSKLSANSGLSREFVDFLEHDLVYTAQAVYNIFGALIFLVIYNLQMAWICLAVIVPVSIISFYYGKGMISLNWHKNNQLEQEIEAIESRDIKTIETHYNRLRNWQIKISDKEAINFGIMEMIVLLVIVLSLILTTSSQNSTNQVGDIIGVYFYILKFSEGLDTIPYLFQRFSSLVDIAERIDSNE